MQLEIEYALFFLSAKQPLSFGIAGIITVYVLIHVKKACFVEDMLNLL